MKEAVKPEGHNRFSLRFNSSISVSIGELRHRLIMVPTKIRKRGCSSSSSSSSRIHNKRAILRGKNRAGLGIALRRSRSSTPVPAWRTALLRTAVESPRHSQSGKSTGPVSARRLAATLWEMSETPSGKAKKHRGGNGMIFFKERMQSGWGSNPLPPRRGDPAGSPSVSERMDRSGTGNRRTTPAASQIVGAAVDSISHASFMEIEARSLPRSSSRSAISCDNRLKDVSNALTTSKELLKIISRFWGQSEKPSSSMSLITALHAELERARLEVNHIVQEQRVDKHEIEYLMKCFAEEKASWKGKRHQAVETAVMAVAGELEVERKLRLRLESLNKRLGKELAEMKAAFVKVVKELESEKRAREMTEKAHNHCTRREFVKEVEKEMAGTEFEGRLHGENVQMEHSKAEEEKNPAIAKLRKQLEVFLRTKGEEKDAKKDCDNEVEDSVESKEGSEESNLLELNMDHSNSKGQQKWTYTSTVDHSSRKPPRISEINARNSSLRMVSLRSSSLQRSVSDGMEWAGNQHSGDGFDMNGHYEAARKSYFDAMQRNKSAKGPSYHKLPSSWLSLSQKKEQSWPSRDPFGSLEEISNITQTNGSKSRTADVFRAESQATRRSKW